MEGDFFGPGPGRSSSSSSHGWGTQEWMTGQHNLHQIWTKAYGTKSKPLFFCACSQGQHTPLYSSRGRRRRKKNSQDPSIQHNQHEKIYAMAVLPTRNPPPRSREKENPSKNHQEITARKKRTKNTRKRKKKKKSSPFDPRPAPPRRKSPHLPPRRQIHAVRGPGIRRPPRRRAAWFGGEERTEESGCWRGERRRIEREGRKKWGRGYCRFCWLPSLPLYLSIPAFSLLLPHSHKRDRSKGKKLARN